MKYSLIICLGIFAFQSAQAIDLKSNLELKELELEKSEIANNKKINRASFLPQLSLESGFEFNKEHPQFEAESGPLLFLQLKQNLFSGGANYLNKKKLNLESEKLKIISQIKERDLKLESYKIINEINSIDKKIALQKLQLSENQKLKSMVSRKIAAGLSTSSEILEFETKELAINETILNLEHETLILKENLLKLFSYQFSFEQLANEFKPEKFEKNANTLIPLEEKLNLINLKRNELLVSAAKTQYLPNIDFEAKAGHITAANNYPLSKQNEYQIAINFSLPLFSGGETYYEIKNVNNKYQFEKNKNAIEAQSLKNSLEIDLKKYQLLEAQTKLAQVNLAKNEKHYELIQMEFKRGIKEAGDLMSALNELTEAKEKIINLNQELNNIDTKLKLYYQY